MTATVCRPCWISAPVPSLPWLANAAGIHERGSRMRNKARIFLAHCLVSLSVVENNKQWWAEIVCPSSLVLGKDR